MVNKYARLAVERSLADTFSQKVRKMGRKPSDVISAALKAVIDAVDHGVDPIDMIHICRIARSVGIGRGGYEVGLNAGALLRAYYTPQEFLEVLTRVGPQAMGVYRIAPGVFRINDPQLRETVRGLLTGMGCRCEESQEILKVVCD